MEKLISVTNLFEKTFEVYKKKWWTLAIIFTINLIAYIVFGISFALTAIPFLSDRPTSLNFDLAVALVVLLSALLSVVLMFWTIISAMICIKEDVFTAKQCLKAGWSRLAAGSWVYCLGALAVLGGLILFIIPALIFAIWFAFAPFVFIFEEKKGTEALKMSKKLVSGYWWPVFSRMLLMMVIIMLIGLIFNRIGGGFINLFVVTPFFLIYRTLIYKDLKRIKSI